MTQSIAENVPRQKKDDDSWPADRLKAAAGPMVAHAVLLARPADQEKRQRSPDSEITGSTNQEGCFVQVSSFEDCGKRAGRIGARRGIKVGHPEGNRQEKQPQERDGRRPGLEWPADHEPPRSAGQMMKHRQSHRTERDPQPEEIPNQVCREKMFGPEQPRRQAKRKAGAAGEECERLHSTEPQPQSFIAHHARAAPWLIGRSSRACP